MSDTPQPGTEQQATPPEAEGGSPGTESTEQLKTEAAEAADDLRRHGEEAAATVRDRATAFAQEQKEAGARQVDSLARAVNRAAEELEQSSPQLAGYARHAASSVDTLSHSLRDRSLSDLFNDANQYARREPVVFFGAAMAAGFALSRFLRSSAQHAQPRPGSQARQEPDQPAGRA